MKDQLEKFILEHRNEFDVIEPNSQVWDKISKNTKKIKKYAFSWNKILWRAAAVIIIFASAFGLSEYLHYNKNHDRQAEVVDTKKIPELAEAEIYYSSMINSKLNEINLLLKDNPEFRKQIISDFSQLDNIYIDLKNDLKDNIANEEVIDAMIQNYRLKLQILEEILNELKKENKNDKKHEKI